MAEVVIAVPPSAVRVGASPHASVLASRLNTTAYPQRAHGRGRPTGLADGARDPVRTGTIVQVCSSRKRASCHADVDRDRRMCRASRSAVDRQLQSPPERQLSCPVDGVIVASISHSCGSFRFGGGQLLLLPAHGPRRSHRKRPSTWAMAEYQPPPSGNTRSGRYNVFPDATIQVIFSLLPAMSLDIGARS